MIILDTNIASAALRRRGSHPAERPVRRWLAELDPSTVFITTVTRAELRLGVAMLPSGQRRKALDLAIDQFLDAMLPQTLVFDPAAADEYGRLVAHRTAIGRPIATADAEIAAIALR
ncbi:MAG: PIN domain-containing protein, partial [Bifidobacteriaceae bacterium]|nr:PIN domain-containing protein [Bifidobacteriaceae bacterium]